MRASYFPALTSLLMLSAAGCYQAGDEGAESGGDTTLAALLADGPLPATMRPSDPIPPPAPPRFCDESEEPDAGVSDGGVAADAGMGEPGGSTGGRPGSGTAGRPGTGTAGGSAPSTDGGMAGGGDFPGEDGEGFCERVPIGFWRFDDCNTERTNLFDSADENNTAFRNVDLQCTPGQEGLAATFARNGDLVYVPDQPAFALEEGVTVAAWVKPDRVDRVQTIFRKRDDATSSIALVINDRKFQFIIRLSSGRLVSIQMPAQARRWTHVAATYDGEYLRLYKNGVEANSKAVVDAIARGVGPLLMGNDIKERRLLGSMDSAWFNTLAAPPDVILELTCLRRPFGAEINPAVGPTVPAGTAVTYAITITNNNSATCQPTQFLGFADVPQEFTSDPSFVISLPIPSGEQGEIAFNVSSGEETDPGTYPLPFGLDTGFDDFQLIEADYTVAEPTGCFVRSGRVLTIRDVSVVDDPLRTSMDGPADDPRTGAWAFGRMMERLSPTDADGPDVTEAMFASFLSPQQVNGFTIQPRPGMQQFVLDSWPRTADGKLDLARAPMRLLAIVNRLDLKNLALGKAGEGRMVYGVLGFGQDGFPLEFTVILEYLLPAADEAEFNAWAEAWHALQALPFPSEEYNAALQALTDRFTGRDAVPSFPNGSALIDIRTNEIALDGFDDRPQWELREFHISETTGFMVPAPIFLNPDASFNGSERLARFINANEATILTETHDVPLEFEGEPFQGASIFNNIDFWDAPGINNPEARHKFSLNTCNGCHGAETSTGFLQIFPREAGQQSFLAGFQTGITVFDPVTGEPRRLVELARRRALLEAVVCADEP